MTTLDIRTQAERPLARNMRLLAHHELNGFGAMGEGMSVQIAKDGRRILWLAHEAAPKNFTAVDVSDPRKPSVVIQTDLPSARMRSNSLDVVGDVMAVAYQTEDYGAPEGGMELFDVSEPERPRSISFFSAAGRHSRGVHQLWFADGEFVHMSAGADDFHPHRPMDDQIYRIVDIRNPSKPVEAGRWWLPGVAVGDSEPLPPLDYPSFRGGGFRAHNTNVYPQRPDRAYLGYLDGGALVLDISDKSRPKLICRWDNSPPYLGFTHTTLPLFSRDLLVVTDESIRNNAEDWPKLAWVLDHRNEAAPLPISTLPLPPKEVFAKRGGRFGAHNLHENQPIPTAFKSDTFVIGTFFNGGVRVYDLTDPFRPEEVAYYVPPAPKLSPTGAVQLNDVFVDERGIVYTVDRHTGGLYVLDMNI